MAKATVEIGAKTTGLKSGLNASLNDLRAWKQAASQQIKQLQAQIKGMQGGAKEGGLSGLIAGSKSILGISAIVAGVKSLADEVDELQDVADATGLSLNTLSKYGIIFGQGGVKAAELRKVLVNIATAQGEVISGSKEAAKKFADLGISQEFVKKSSPEQMIEAVTKALANQGSVQEALAKSSSLTGSKNTRWATSARQMGRDYKQAMADVKGALTDEDAKKIAENMDKIEVAFKGAKNEMANWGGTAIGWIEEAAKAWGQVSVGADNPMGNPWAQTAGEKEAAEAKKKADADALAAQEKLEASAKEELELERKKAEAAEDRKQKIQQLSDEIEEADKSARDNAVEQLSLEEKQVYWMQQMRSAQDELNSAGQDEVKIYEAKLKIGKAQAALDETKAAKVKKLAAEMAMTPEERASSKRESRAAERRQSRAERTVDARERDKIDRDLRSGRISIVEASSRMQNLNLDKGKKGMTESELLQRQIAENTKKLADGVDRLKTF